METPHKTQKNDQQVKKEKNIPKIAKKETQNKKIVKEESQIKQEKAKNLTNKNQKINKLPEKKRNNLPRLESPEARENIQRHHYNNHSPDIKKSKTPTYEQKKVHKELISRAKTPEYKTSNEEKYFVSKNKLESKRKDQNNAINQQNNILDNYNEEKFYEIVNQYDELVNSITVKSLQVIYFSFEIKS